MQLPKWISDHPVRATVLGLACFLLWSLPEWLGNVWPLFTDKTIPQWAAEQRWPSMTPGAFHWLSLVIGSLLLALSVATLLAITRSFVPAPIVRGRGDGDEPSDGSAQPEQQAGRWLSERERSEESNSARKAESIPPIPDGEFLISTKEKNGGVHIRLQNVQAKEKTGFVMRVRDVQLWSELLANGKGGFGPWAPFVALGRHLDLIGGVKKGSALHFHDPTFFELVRNPHPGPWMLHGVDGGIPLRDGRWRFALVLHWNGCALELEYDVRLTTRKDGKLAEFLTFEPQPGASPPVA